MPRLLVLCCWLALYVPATPRAAAQAWPWERGEPFVSGTEVHVAELAPTADGVVLAGSASGSASLGGVSLDVRGGSDVLVARVRGDAVLWAHAFGGALDDRATAVAVDPAGGVLVAGLFRGRAAFGPDTLVADEAEALGHFVVRLRPDGEVAWARAVPGGRLGRGGLAVAPDGPGGAYVGGTRARTPATGPYTAGGDAGSDGFVARFGADGTLLWELALVGPGRETVDGLALHAGGVVLVGAASEAARLGETALAPQATDALVARLDAEGAVEWTATFGGDGDQLGQRLAVGPDGGVTVSGRFYRSARIGGADMAGGYGAFAAGLGPDGAVLWGHEAARSPAAVAVGADRAVWLGGSTRQASPWEDDGVFLGQPSPNGYTGPASAYLARLDPDGRVAWTDLVPGDAGESVSVGALAVSDGALWAAGAASAAMASALFGADGDRTFVARYDPAGRTAAQRDAAARGVRRVRAAMARGQEREAEALGRLLDDEPPPPPSSPPIEAPRPRSDG